MCLNAGTDPPDSNRPVGASRAEACIDPAPFTPPVLPGSQQLLADAVATAIGVNYDCMLPLETKAQGKRPAGHSSHHRNHSSHSRVSGHNRGLGSGAYTTEGSAGSSHGPWGGVADPRGARRKFASRYSAHAADPTPDHVKSLCTQLRDAAGPSERALLHVCGRGTPRPTSRGELWAFDATFSQYLPVPVTDMWRWASGCDTLMPAQGSGGAAGISRQGSAGRADAAAAAADDAAAIAAGASTVPGLSFAPVTMVLDSDCAARVIPALANAVRRSEENERQVLRQW